MQANLLFCYAVSKFSVISADEIDPVNNILTKSSTKKRYCQEDINISSKLVTSFPSLS